MEPVASVLGFLFFGFIAIVLLVIAVKTIRIVPQATVMLVERLGRFDRVASSGLNILVPFLDKPRAVLLDQHAAGSDLDRPARTVHRPAAATGHHARQRHDSRRSVVYWQITDPVKAVYEMNDLVGGIVQLTITACAR